MGPFNYEIMDIQGDYAQLRRTDTDSEPLLLVAMALLPMGCDVGMQLQWEWGEYTILDGNG